MTDTQNDKVVEKKSKLKAAVIIGAPLLVLILSSLLYTSGWVTGGKTNKGQLILPPIDFNQLPLIKDENYQASDTWLLVIAGTGSCDDACKNMFYLARQVNIAMGKRLDRVSRVFLDTDKIKSKGLNQLIKSEYPLMQVVGIDPQDLLTAFAGVHNEEAIAKHHIYVVDPLGNLMMSYDEANSGKEILKDLKKLLKLSNIG